MKSLLTAALTSAVLALPTTASAQFWQNNVAPPRAQVYPYANPYSNAPSYVAPNAPVRLNGRWYMNGEPDKRTAILQYGPNRALFINEHGSQAWGTIAGNRVWIPTWSSSVGPGLVGTVWGGRIVWPDGSFWSRMPM